MLYGECERLKVQVKYRFGWPRGGPVIFVDFAGPALADDLQQNDCMNVIDTEKIVAILDTD